MIFQIIKKIKFDLKADRLGPDIPFTHWRLYFKKSMEKLCKKKFAIFGEGAEFRAGAYADGCSKIFLGRGVVIRPGSIIFAEPSGETGKIIIEDYCLLGSLVQIYASNHNFDSVRKEIYFQGQQQGQDVVLKKGCWLGGGVIVLPGVVIGKNSVVGAGSVVTKSIPDFCVAVGNPAKIIKRLKGNTCDVEE